MVSVYHQSAAESQVGSLLFVIIQQLSFIYLFLLVLKQTFWRSFTNSDVVAAEQWFNCKMAEAFGDHAFINRNIIRIQGVAISWVEPPAKRRTANKAQTDSDRLQSVVLQIRWQLFKTPSPVCLRVTAVSQYLVNGMLPELTRIELASLKTNVKFFKFKFK